MITEEYFKEKTVEYCKARGIEMYDGCVDRKYREEILAFIKAQQRIDRYKTAQKEERDKLRISGETLTKAIGEPSLFESPIEELMWNGLSSLDLTKHSERQYQIGKYRVDLAFPAAMLVVECDGREYHFTDKSKIEYDQKRDKFLSKKGWRVMHIHGTEIRRNISACVGEIIKALKPFIPEIKGAA